MTTPSTPPSPPPRRRGGWQPGQSGNPRGKLPGTGRIAKIRQEIGDHLPDIIEVLVLAAKSGDTQAARCLMDRSIAALRPVEPTAPFRLPDGTLSDRADAVLAAIADGSLSPQQGTQLIGALAGVAKVIEVDNVVARITALEAKYAAAE